MSHDNPLRGLLTDQIDTSWSLLGCLSDRQLVTQVGDLLAEPPQEPADSFVLRAPLELMARAELLPDVAPPARDQARRRIVEIATEWNAHRPHLGGP